MKIQDVQKKEKRDITIHIRISKKDADFMTENEISPSKVFHRSLKELGRK